MSDTPANWRKVCIQLQLIGMTDRDAWEWGEGLAKFLQSSIAEDSPDHTDAQVECICADVLYPVGKGGR